MDAITPEHPTHATAHAHQHDAIVDHIQQGLDDINAGRTITNEDLTKLITERYGSRLTEEL